MSQQFRTQYPAFHSDLKIDHQASTMLIGSCFAERMAEKLDYYGFPLVYNPFGILYNAFSISKSLEFITSDKYITDSDLFFHNNLWHSKWHHGSFSSVHKDQVIAKTNRSLQDARDELKNVKTIIITLGTAYHYTLIESQEILGNCHKLPSKSYTKQRAVVKDIVDHLGKWLKLLMDNKDRQIILSVSPVRHVKDGFIENQRSKSILLLAVEQICKAHPRIEYFPAYELIMDDLRDYRFFNKDLVHPNDQASEYVWSYFQNAYFESKQIDLLKEIENLRKSIDHRPLHPETGGHQRFLSNLAKKIAAFKSKYPEVRITHTIDG